ncbi:RHS repeat-associated core domain-containing protein, partial [Silvimonas amylolytica]|uniref:RHS repeat-associated core domain-containing protein n=1 Tax=Silvimonas amylolytica TaxID=449663 RepID=UPI00166A8E85
MHPTARTAGKWNLLALTAASVIGGIALFSPVHADTSACADWSNSTSYVAGDCVAYNGKQYTANYANTGDNPASYSGSTAPWSATGGSTSFTSAATTSPLATSGSVQIQSLAAERAVATATPAATVASGLPAHVSTVSTINTYDALGRLVTAMDGKGFQTTYTYDANGNRLTSKDAQGYLTSYQYDALNRLTQITDPKNGITKMAYDANDHLVTVTDPKGFVTTYNYDGLDNLLSQVSPDTGTTTYTQDAAGNVKTKTDSRGKTGTYTYDALNRVKSVAWGDQTWTFNWDTATNGVGRLGSFSDQDGTTTYTYDTQGRVTSSRRVAGTLSQTVGYGWSAGNRLTAITYPSGLQVAYTWSNGVITGVTINGNPLASNIVYQAWGAPLAWTWGNGQLWGRSGDAAGYTTAQTTGDAVRTYQYEGRGNITDIADSTHPTLEQIFQYDELDRITQNNAAGVVYKYTYDANGNRLSRSNGSTNYPYVYDTASNKLKSIGAIDAFDYDAAGLQAHAFGIHNLFDNAGRLYYTHSSAGDNSFRYNAFGQRVSKNTPALSLRFMYDEAGHLLGEYTATGTPVQETVYLGDWPIATVRPVSGVSTAYYVWPDHLGTPRQVTDATSKQVLWRWDSEAFGDLVPNQDPQGTGNTFVYNLRFPGQYWDAEFYRSYNGARDYNPFHGRYIESDPIGLASGQASTYAYVAGNPVKQSDSTGLDGT